MRPDAVDGSPAFGNGGGGQRSQFLPSLSPGAFHVPQMRKKHRVLVVGSRMVSCLACVLQTRGLGLQGSGEHPPQEGQGDTEED